METLEISARSVEEAIQRALKQLGVTREQVEVTVLSEGRAGILGIGAEDAKVRVSLIESAEQPESPAAKAREILEELLKALGLEAAVEVGSIPDESGTEPLLLNISGDDLGILIGRRGQTLAALQYIVRVILAHQEDLSVPVVIDIEGYKERRYDALRALARRVAEQVAARRAPVALRPMPAYERRIVHLALANHPSVTTESTGVGSLRKVVVQPRGR